MTSAITDRTSSPTITRRKALVFLDPDEPGRRAPEPARRLVSALRGCGFEVDAPQSLDSRDHQRLSTFLDEGAPGDLLLVRWPRTALWSGSDFTTLIRGFGARAGDSAASALLMVVDFGWIGGAAADEPTVSTLLTPPGVAAAALTTGLAIGAEVRPGGLSLTEVVATGLLDGATDLDRDGVISVGDLLAHALAVFGEDAEFQPRLLTSAEGLEIPVALTPPAPGSGIPPELAPARDRVGGQPTSAERLVGMVYDEYLGADAQALLRRGSLLADDEELTPEVAGLLTGRPEARAELAEWRLLGTGMPFVHPSVAEAGRARLTAAELDEVPGVLRRWRAGHRTVQPRARLTPDRWTIDDGLGHRVYAEAIAAFVRHPETRPPLTIGIKGPWGTGKTSLMRMIQNDLDPGAATGNPGPIQLPRALSARPPSRLLKLAGRLWPGPDRVTNAEVRNWAKRPPEPLSEAAAGASGWRPTVWFNPWMYQNGEQVWAGLAHEIITQVTARLPRAERERFWLRLNLARIDREVVRRRAYRLAALRLVPTALGLAMALLLAGASQLATPLLPALEGTAAAISSAGALAAVATGWVRLARFFTESADTAFTTLVHPPDLFAPPPETGDLLAEPGYSARTGFLHLVQTDMRHVLGLVATEERPLVVFVDDLDRCSSGTVAQVIEAINLFLAGEFPDCVFVLAMEPEVVAAHVELAYRDLTESMPESLRQGIGWRFLEKIVQLPLSVPLLADDTRLPAYVRALMGISDTRRMPEMRVPQQQPQNLDQELVARLEHAIRARRPQADTLDSIARATQHVVGAPAETAGTLGGLWRETRAAADRVFDDLYSDENAYRAIEVALPALSASNPRELKRYVNVFRFYSFVTYRQRLAGERPASDAEVAKLSALTVRWPQLLSLLTRDCPVRNETTLGLLEQAARADDWVETAQLVGVPAEASAPLRALLASGPPVADLARRLL
ncbi:P-loop NTPase fold protein [Acrocarpospora sp. B8E8]|uniref:KAP family P-loop NTPase fold protein n=1 Tax=Acrocarpospora sp. B8E8 TaxID=3153572 RepID=UPI00325E6A5D